MLATETVRGADVDPRPPREPLAGWMRVNLNWSPTWWYDRDLGDGNLVIVAQSPGDIDRVHRHVQVERHPQLSQMRPLRHRLQVVHRLAGFDFDDPNDLLALLVERVDNRVGILFSAAHADRRILLGARIDAHLHLALLQVLLE